MMARLLRSPTLPALWFLVAFGASLVATTPAFLVDLAISKVSSERIRLLSAAGSVWDGRGLLVEQAGGRYQPWMDLAWRIELGEVWRGRLAIVFAVNGQQENRIRLDPAGFELTLAGNALPLAPLARTLPHAAARLGWSGALRATGQLAHCDWKLACRGDLRLDLEALGLDVLPDARLGRYRLEARADGAGVALRIGSDEHSRLSANGHGELTRNGRTRGELILGGDAELVRQIGAMTADLAQRKADGTLQLAW